MASSGSELELTHVLFSRSATVFKPEAEVLVDEGGCRDGRYTIIDIPTFDCQDMMKAGFSKLSSMSMDNTINGSELTMSELSTASLTEETPPPVPPKPLNFQVKQMKRLQTGDINPNSTYLPIYDIPKPSS